jgi:hypothetical protein
MPKNLEEPERPQTTIWRRVACWISKHITAQPHTRDRAPTITHTYEKFNTYCFTTTTMVSWTRLIVTLYTHCLSCSSCPQFHWQGTELKVNDSYLNQVKTKFTVVLQHAISFPSTDENAMYPKSDFKPDIDWGDQDVTTFTKVCLGSDRNFQEVTLLVWSDWVWKERGRCLVVTVTWRFRQLLNFQTHRKGNFLPTTEQ